MNQPACWRRGGSAGLRSWLVLLGLWLVMPGYGRPFPAASLDSLRHLRRWPLATQLRLVGAAERATPASGPVAAQLLAQPQDFTPAVRQDLLLHLIDYYFARNRPSLVVLRGLECRQLAITQRDSARRSRAGAVLSYAYSLLEQPRRALQFGEEAQRFAQGSDKFHLLLRGVGMTAIAAGQLGDNELLLRCHREELRLARLTHDAQNEAIALQNLAQTSLDLHHDAAARCYIDSAVARNHVLEPNEREGIPVLHAILAQHQGHAREAVRLLLPTLANAQRQNHQYFELGVLEALMPPLTQLGRYREAYDCQRRLAQLRQQMAEEATLRHGQELQAIYETEQRSRELGRQRQHITALQSQLQTEAARRQQYVAWLVVALALAGIAGGYVAYRRRLTRIRREEQLRAAIAADLHEQVGTLLTRVTMQAELLRETPAEAVSPGLDRLVTNTRSAARTVRDVVWSIDPQADTVGALADRLREYLYHATANHAILTRLEVRDLTDTQPLRAERRQQLYLIGKEAIDQTLRATPAVTRLHLTLSHQPGHLHLHLLADGPDTEQLDLRRMQQRAGAVGGTVAAHDAGGSVHIEARIPQ